ncbi:MAG: hypothetical protein K6E98_07015 [Lachnospiraceae bacterium]|nr:hypothetical protein [Lachnospiraceae bacterium]
MLSFFPCEKIIRCHIFSFCFCPLYIIDLSAEFNMISQLSAAYRRIRLQHDPSSGHRSKLFHIHLKLFSGIVYMYVT